MAMNTGLLINKLSNCLRRRSGEIQKSLGISGAQGAILDYILVVSAGGEVCQRDIEKEFGLRPSTATEVLKALEAAGLIRRVPAPGDARRKNIVFTQQAESLQKALAGEIAETEALLLSRVSAEEQAQFMAIGQKMLESLGGE